jgi:hypothetical protein
MTDIQTKRCSGYSTIVSLKACLDVQRPSVSFTFVGSRSSEALIAGMSKSECTGTSTVMKLWRFRMRERNNMGASWLVSFARIEARYLLQEGWWLPCIICRFQNTKGKASVWLCSYSLATVSRKCCTRQLRFAYPTVTTPSLVSPKM